MKRFFAAAIALLGLAFVSSAAAQVANGAAAPNFTLTDVNGVSHNLSDFKGKTVVLEWTNHQCPFVVKFYRNGDMQRLQREWTGKGVVWLSIVSSAEGKQGYITAEQGKAMFASANWGASALLLDPTGKVGKQYDARTTPHMYIINPEGVLVYQGAIDDKRSANSADIATATNFVSQALNELMAGKPVSMASTTPYGCSVKY